MKASFTEKIESFTNDSLLSFSRYWYATIGSKSKVTELLPVIEGGRIAQRNVLTMSNYYDAQVIASAMNIYDLYLSGEARNYTNEILDVCVQSNVLNGWYGITASKTLQLYNSKNQSIGYSTSNISDNEMRFILDLPSTMRKICNQ